MKLNTRKLSLKKGQKKISNFKSIEELRTEIHSLEDSRYNHYLRMVKELQLIELDYKSKTNNPIYKNIDSQRKQIDAKYRDNKKHAIAEYNEIIRPIDKQIKKLRLEVRKLVN